MFKLRSTWNDVISPAKLYALDGYINAIDKNWPISAAPPNIHVNPKFLNNVYEHLYEYIFLSIVGFTYDMNNNLSILLWISSL